MGFWAFQMGTLARKEFLLSRTEVHFPLVLICQCTIILGSGKLNTTSLGDGRWVTSIIACT